MNFEEYAGKPLLRAAGIATPRGSVVTTADEAERTAADIGPCVVKAQVPTGKRGKAGGIQLAASASQARAHAQNILGMQIGEFAVEKLLIEAQVPIVHEMYAAILNDADTKGPLLLFSAQGGMDIEEIAANHADALLRLPIDIRSGLDAADIAALLPDDVPGGRQALAALLIQLYQAYTDNDAELIEINPLVATSNGDLIALDCKFTLDDSAIPRREALAATGTPDKLTALELRAQDDHLKFIELDGEVGVIANGAGLTMTTMDAVRHFGGSPANFLEIGGDSYTKAKPGLELVLANPKVKALLVNFCGAFARTDVMADGVTKAWAELKPDIPIFFTIHGTGEDEAVAMVRERLGVEPIDLMDDAVKAAVEAAR